MFSHLPDVEVWIFVVWIEVLHNTVTLCCCIVKWNYLATGL